MPFAFDEGGVNDVPALRVGNQPYGVLPVGSVDALWHADRFDTLEPGLLDWYLATGEWRGRAGGYGIQGAGAALVRAVSGDYENVVGLPLASLLDIYPQLLAR